MTMAAFTFVDPLLPLYIQKVGNLTVDQAAFWAGLAASGLGAAMFFISPVWGILADRFGRKAMVMRAMFGGAVILSLMSLAPNIYLIVILRCFQGFVTGSVAAMTALASGTVPRNKMPLAMGVIMLAVFCGQSLGPLAGGFIAGRWGYHATFYASGAFLLAAGLIVLIMVKEHFVPVATPRGGSLRAMFNLAKSSEFLPLMAVLALVSAGQGTVGPIMSLRIEALVGVDKAPHHIRHRVQPCRPRCRAFESGRRPNRPADEFASDLRLFLLRHRYSLHSRGLGRHSCLVRRVLGRCRAFPRRPQHLVERHGGPVGGRGPTGTRLRLVSERIIVGRRVRTNYRRRSCQCIRHPAGFHRFRSSLSAGGHPRCEMASQAPSSTIDRLARLVINASTRRRGSAREPLCYVAFRPRLALSGGSRILVAFEQTRHLIG